MKQLFVIATLLLAIASLLADQETPWYPPNYPNHLDLPGITLETLHTAEPASEPTEHPVVFTPPPPREVPLRGEESPWDAYPTPNHIDIPGITLETIDAATVPPPIVVDVPPSPKHEKKISPAERLTTGSYRLRPTDVMVIGIYGEPTSRRPVTVDPTGCISYLFVNGLNVKGCTIGETRIALESRLKKYYKSPLVTITLVDAADEHFTILGEVMQAGRYPIIGRTTLLNAMAISGGFRLQEFRFETYDQADLAHSFIARDGQYLCVDFERLVSCGDLSQDVPLQNGDYIYIAPSSLDKVYILGEVRRPAYIQYLHTISLVEALAMAGGVNLRASSRVAVLRGSLASPIQYLIDINLVLKGYACDFTLEPGDIVYVPPFRFNTAKEIIRSAISTFVGTVASVAGSRAFVELTPAAANSNLIQPVPIINTGGNFVTPIVP